jgi:MFS family permease
VDHSILVVLLSCNYKHPRFDHLNLDPIKISTEGPWPPLLSAFRHRDFRILWTGLVVSAVGTWMQIVAQSLLVLKLTHCSAFALGCVSLSQASAFFLFALIGGGFADRVNRKRLLLVTQASLMVLAATLGLLTATSKINVPVVALCAFLSGVILSFDQPARAALISTLVPAKDLLNAISLQSAVFNGAAVAGPVLAGLTIDWIGLPANFYLNALSFTGVLFGLLSLPAHTALPAGGKRLKDQIRDAMGIVGRDPVLLRQLYAYGMLLFAGPSLPLLVPVLAAGRLLVGPATLGLLLSAAGLGAVVGSLGLASSSSPNQWVGRTAVACWCVALAVIGISNTVQLTFCALVLLGASQSIAGAITSALLQTRVPPQQRGQMMSLNTLLLMGVRPLGDFPAGAVMAFIGAPATAVGSAAVVAITVGIVFAKRISNEFRS